MAYDAIGKILDESSVSAINMELIEGSGEAVFDKGGGPSMIGKQLKNNLSWYLLYHLLYCFKNNIPDLKEGTSEK